MIRSCAWAILTLGIVTGCAAEDPGVGIPIDVEDAEKELEKESPS